jgi:sugar lactone lactonase YvrE
MRNPSPFSVLTGLLASVLCAAQTPAADARHDERPVLRVPVTDAPPVIDGRLDEPVWNDAARTGPLQVISGGLPQTGAGASSTEVFLLRDDNRLVIALRCLGDLAGNDEHAVGLDAVGEDPVGEPSALLPAALPIRPGSFIRIPKSLPADQELGAVTLECWVRLRRLDAWQTLMGQHNYPVASGYALGTDIKGRIAFYLGDGGVYRPEGALFGPVLAQDRWQHVVGTWDGKIKSLWIDGRLAAQQEFEGPFRPGTAPLWLGACGHNGPAVNHLQGDLAMPVIYGRALSADEIQARHRDRGRTPAAGDAVLACWPGAASRGRRVADQSPHGRHGHVVGSGTDLEFVDLLIDSNADRNSCYLIRLTPEDGGKVACSYNEHTPPWHDRTWQPEFEFAVAWEPDGWTAELALPFEIFCKNKTLASEIGFNVRRFRVPGQEIHCWHGAFEHPGDWGTLTGIPARDSLPAPDYAIPKAAPFSSAAQWGVNVYYVPGTERRALLAEQQGQHHIALGPGSAHPGTTGEVRLEFEGFLLAGDPHACGIIWDLAVDPQKGELYVLSDPRQVREAPELRVFDRRGRYLRTVMPFSPALPRANVQDLCAMTVREGDTDLVIPKLFETLCGSLSLYGAYWHLPQKVSLAPDGDLILSNIYRGTLWRLRPDGSLPREGWTSVYHAQRNEPFESHSWTQDVLNAQDLKNYLSFQSLHYPYFCFDPDGALYVSAGQSSRPTRNYGYHWEVGQQEVTYQRELSGTEGRDAYVWKYRLHGGVKREEQDALSGFASPSGLVHDGSHLIVADSGHNRLQVLGNDGRPVATVTHYEHEGQQHPIHGPTALAMDRDKSLYVLVASQPRSADQPVVERTLAALQQDYLLAAQQDAEHPTRLIKLESWQEPRLLAASPPLHRDVLQIAVDAGVYPPLVWVANGSGPGSLLQLAGDDLSVRAEFGGRTETLRCPRQSGNQPILNIDPQTGDLYVEDDSNYRLKQYGTVYRIDQAGNVLQQWPPLFFNALGLRATSPWWTLDYDLHFRYPDEPLFIDSIFGKDGRVYRWKLTKDGVEILRFDRAGTPIPFATTGTNALFVDPPMQVGFWHDVYHGVEVDRHGRIYYVAKADVDAAARPVSAYQAVARQVNVYDADGRLQTRGLLRLDAVRGLQVDDDGNLYAMHLDTPAERAWDNQLVLSKFPPSGGDPLWSRRWEGYVGQAQALFAPCHCITARQHQTLDGKGYLYAAAKHSVQVIDCATGGLVGEFGSYGNLDCQGPGSPSPHPELPFGLIAALAVWQDRLFVVDVLNRRIVKCRIVVDETKRIGARVDP